MNNTEEFEIIEVNTVKTLSGAKIAVIGVGGGGGNMLNHLAKMDLASQVKTIAANTDAQALSGCKADVKIQLGPNIAGGKGAGMDPEIGKKAALESYQEIKDSLMQ